LKGAFKMVFALVLITLALAVSLEVIIAKSRKLSSNTLPATLPVFNKSSLHTPEGYYFSKFHTWALPEENTVKVGIDNFAFKALGNIRINEITPEGKSIKAGDTVIEAEVHGQKINFRSPVSGIIKSVNKLVFNKNINDVYGKDWGLVIEKDKNPVSSENLFSGSEAFQWMKSELRKLKDFLNEASFTPQAVGVTMYDGGNFVEGVLSTLDKETIKDFEERFLNEQNNG
jgi:glycine cleavage system H protein